MDNRFTMPDTDTDPASASARPDSITRVAGIEVGHFTDTRRPTGCSVVIARAGAVAGVDVRGAAPGTRETDLLHPSNLVDRAHAILLAGGFLLLPLYFLYCPVAAGGGP
jgi:L-aminopeptidase/D-esterase-like protein